MALKREKKLKARVESSDLADQLFPEIEVDHEALNIPPEQRRLHTETFDYSVSTLIDYLKKDHIFIPEFQRGYVWSNQQASRLIESLIIQCPIPVIYLSQEKDERLAVIDGNQRINSINRYLRNEFGLSGLTAYPELDGLKFFELDPRFQRHIVNRTLRCIVILKETHPQVQFDVFERLNTGSKALTAQELRHGLYYGTLMELLSKLKKDKEVISIFPKNYADRMKAEELILRYFAIKEDFKEYLQPVSAFLNNYCKKKRSADPWIIDLMEEEFKEVLEKTTELFGKELLFRGPQNSDLKLSFYVALFDAQLIAVASIDKDDWQKVLGRKVSIRKKYEALFSDPAFIKSITKATPNKNNISFRIAKIKEILA